MGCVKKGKTRSKHRRQGRGSVPQAKGDITDRKLESPAGPSTRVYTGGR